MDRVRLFFQRMGFFNAIIVAIVLWYDLWLYSRMIQLGLGRLVAFVMTVGIATGMVAWPFIWRNPKRWATIIDLVGYLTMAGFLTARFANVGMPNWVLMCLHVLIWVWFTMTFWMLARPPEWSDGVITPNMLFGALAEAEANRRSQLASEELDDRDVDFPQDDLPESVADHNRR